MMRVGIGAVAGQGLSVGGLAMVNPAIGAAVAGALLLKNTAQDLVAQATVWEKFRVALTDIEGSAGKAEVAIAKLYETAKQPGVGLKQAEQTYIQYRALNVEGAKAERTIKAIANAVALSGGGATEFERVNYQIVQMLSKGKVLEEDLRIMRNSMPRLTVAMREAFGTTTAEGIRKAGYNAEEFLNGIVTQFEKLPKASQTLESAIENATTAWSRLKATLVNTDFVKTSLEGWTGLLENMTAALEKESINWSQLLKDSFHTSLPAMAGKFASGGYNLTPEQVEDNRIADIIAAKQRLLSADKTLPQYSRNSSGDVVQVTYEQKLAELEEEIQAYSRARRMAAVNTYIGGLGAPNVVKEEEAKADAKILLENEKLGIQLSQNNEYEKQRKLLIVEYTAKINEAKNTEDKAALTKQQGLQLAILAKKQREEEAKALEKIRNQIESQRIAAMDVSDFEKKRLEIGVKYELLMREATTAAQKQALEVAKGLELEAARREQNIALAKEMADIQKEAAAAFESATGKNWAAYAAANPGSTESETGSLSLTKSMVEGRKKASELEYKYAPDLDKIRLDNEKARQEILDATYLTALRRNELLEQADREYLVKNSQFWTDVMSNMASSTSSMFSDFASVAKMKVDATYQKERESIMANTKLTSKQREALLKQADDRREKQLGGTYAKMFKLSKAFAIADSLVQIMNAQAKSANLPFPANLAAMSTTLAATGSIVANIAAIKYAGQYAKGGYIPEGSFGIAGEIGPEIVMGPARVTSTAESAKLLGKGETKVVINNYANASVSTNQLPDGTLEVVIEAAVAAAEGRISGNIAAGRGAVPKAIEQTYGVRRAR